MQSSGIIISFFNTMPRFTITEVNEETVLEPLDTDGETITLSSNARIIPGIAIRVHTSTRPINEYMCYRCRTSCDRGSALLMKPLLSRGISHVPDQSLFEGHATICATCFASWPRTDIQEDNHTLGPARLSFFMYNAEE